MKLTTPNELIVAGAGNVSYMETSLTLLFGVMLFVLAIYVILSIKGK